MAYSISIATSSSPTTFLDPKHTATAPEFVLMSAIWATSMETFAAAVSGGRLWMTLVRTKTVRHPYVSSDLTKPSAV